MIQIGIENGFMRDRLIAYATDASIETGVNIFDVIVDIICFDDALCAATVNVAYKFEYCYKQQYASEPFHGSRHKPRVEPICKSSNEVENEREQK